MTKGGFKSDGWDLFQPKLSKYVYFFGKQPSDGKDFGVA